MGKMYDLSARLGTSRPSIRFAEDVEFKVNNSMAAAIQIRALQKKMEEGKEDEFDAVKKMVTVALGKEAVDYLIEKESSISDWLEVTQAVSYALSEEDLPEEEDQEDKNKPGKK